MFTGPISPELVLVDPELRSLALRQLCRESTELPDWSSPVWPRPTDAAPATQPARRAEAGNPETDEAKTKREQGPQLVRASQWWLAVLVYSTVIVALVLGGNILLHSLF